MEQVDFLIIGAGVVGLAAVAELSGRYAGCSVVVMDRHETFGQETSSRNSEVIHAGIYYPTGSLKAALCTGGKVKLYAFCRAWNIPHRQIGKLIIARTEEEVPALDNLLKQGRDNGVADLELLDDKAVHELEPNIRAVAGLLSPSTGIIDSHSLMKRLESIARQNEAMFAYNHKVIEIKNIGPSQGCRVTYEDPAGNRAIIGCRWLINCAGLSAGTLAEAMGIDTDESGYRVYPCKGEYFSLPGGKAKLISRLIYPPPLKELEGLGIHVTKSLDGRARLGPSAFYPDCPDYSVDSGHANAFYQAAKSYLPFLESGDLQPDMAGIRPKLQGPCQPWRDFVIRHEADRGLPGIINLLGIESPGLTSCLSIAEFVADIVEQDNLLTNIEGKGNIL